MTELEKMKQGLPYRFDDPEIVHLKNQAIDHCTRLNSINPADVVARTMLARRLLGHIGEHPDIQPGFHCDYGFNISVGDYFTTNFNVTILDGAPVTIGDYCMVGPGVLIATTNHPMNPQGRRDRISMSKPVTIGDDVWLGGNVTIVGGMTIGNNVVVAAGAVVTKDIPDNSVVAGVPAKIIRKLDPNASK